MPAIKTADRVVVSVTATESGDWQVVDTPTGFQGITSANFADGDLLHGFLRHENGTDWEVYDGDTDDTLLTIANVSGTVTLTRPASPYSSSNNNNRITAGSGTHTLALGVGAATMARTFRELNPTWQTFTSADATPSVSGYRFFETNGSTSITRFDNMETGKLFYVRRGNADIIIEHSANIDLANAENVTLTAENPVVVFAEQDGVALQLSPPGIPRRIPNLVAETTLTIASGAVTLTRAAHVIAAESGTTDDLVTVTTTGFPVGSTIRIRADAGDTITVKASGGNITTENGSDIILDAVTKYATLTVTASGVVAALGGGASAALRRLGFFDVTEYGASTTAAGSVNVAAYEAAYAAAVAAGGGIIYWPAGDFALTRNGSAAASWDNDKALWIRDNNIHIRGAGRSLTRLHLENSADCHIIKIGQREGGTVTVDDFSVTDLELDGNRANQTQPTDADDHWGGVDISSGCTRGRLARLHIHDMQYYGFGLQREGFRDILIEDIEMDDLGADGFDYKNDDATAEDVVFKNINVRRHGLATTLGASNWQAGADMRSACTASGISVREFGTARGKHGIRFLNDADNEDDLLHPSALTHFTVEGDGSADTVGIYAEQHRSAIGFGTIKGVVTGMQVLDRETRVTFVDFDDTNTNGISISGNGGNSYDGDNSVFFGCNLRGLSGTAVTVGGTITNAQFIGCNVRANGTGYSIASGANQTLIMGGSCTGNSIAQISNAGTDTVIQNVSGLNFDQVEETAWTPSPTFATAGDAAFTVTLANGRYMRIGNIIHAMGTLEFSVTHTTASGEFRITGLPAAAGASVGRGVGPAQRLDNVDLPAGAVQISAIVNQTTQYVLLRAAFDAATSISLNTTHFPTGTAFTIDFAVSYAIA